MPFKDQNIEITGMEWSNDFESFKLQRNSKQCI